MPALEDIVRYDNVMSKINKIVFLVQSSFNKRDYKRFGFEIFIKDGFEVYVWDFTPFLFPRVDKLVTPPDHFEYENLIRFKYKKDAVTALNELGKNTFIIPLFEYDFSNFCIFKAITKNNLPYGMLISAAFPKANRKYSEGLIKRLSGVSLKQLFSRMLMKIPPYTNIKTANFFFTGGAKSLPKSSLIDSKTEVLWIHAFDYDIFLEQANESQREEKHIVFLDSNIAFNPEYIYRGMTPLVSAKKYFLSLCRFFDRLEAKFGREVIIASHPRSHYEKSPGVFQDRKIVRGKTAELVRKSKFVVLHWSVSLTFAVLFKKPMVFISTDELEKGSHAEMLNQFASTFGKMPINIDETLDIDFDNELYVDDKIYEKYKNDFIKIKGTEELPFWQVVSNKIRAYL